MPIEPMEDHPRSPSPQPGTPAPTGAAAASKLPLPLERSKFGGTERRTERPDDGDAPFSRSDLRKGGVVTCEIIEVKDGGLEVKIAGSDLTAFIKRSELARDRADQRPERFAVGEKVDARVTLFDRELASLTRDDVARTRRRIGIVHQDCKFLDHMSIAANMALPPRLG